MLSQEAAVERERQLESLRETAQAQTRAAKEGAAAAQRALADLQAAAAADSQRLAEQKTELQKQLNIARVRLQVDIGNCRAVDASSLMDSSLMPAHIAVLVQLVS